MDLPHWWTWELSFIGHLDDRMEERGFNEVDLRAMLEHPKGLERARKPGRWLVRCRRGQEPWTIVIEPDEVEELIVVVTAYPRERL